MKKLPKRIIISRTDSIGDVALTLAMAGGIKKLIPDAEIVFLGRTYTAALVGCCVFVNEFADWDEVQDKSAGEKALFFKALNADAIVLAFPDKEICRFSRAAGIPMRIATAGRMHTWFTCTHRVWFSRRKSGLHESVLNFHLLRPLGRMSLPALEDVFKLSGWKVPVLTGSFESYFQQGKKHVILHPKSKGSAPEWSIENFQKLAALLPPDDFVIFITGTESEGRLIGDAFADFSHVSVMCGRMSLVELIAFIARSDALVAASTGPLHIAGLSGIQAIGLFSPAPPVDPGRWRPIGPKAEVLVASHHPLKGQTLDIMPAQVAQRLGVRL